MLYHVSERGDIARFSPIVETGGVVWAITKERLKNYLLPRDCPRVTFYARPDTTEHDRRELLGDALAIVAIESAWYARAASTRLFVYSFAAEPFELKDEIAGYYTFSHPVDALECREVINPIEELRRERAELRVLTCLWALRETVAKSSLGFSIIRMRNAGPRPPGFVSAFPVS
jgi:uncharacterized protein DUF6886